MDQSFDQDDRLGLDRLSDRQRECLAYVGGGLTSKQIAREIGLHPKTVDHHIAAAVERLNAKNRTEAAGIIRRSHDRPSVAVAENAAMPLPPAAPEEEALIVRPSPSHVTSFLLPLGGARNELDWRARIRAMVIITAFVIMFASVIILSVAGVIHVVS